MVEVPFETRRLLQDLPELLAGKEPVLQTPRAQELLAQDPAARGMIVAALEIGAALDGSARAAKGARRLVSPQVRTSVEKARRFFRRRLVEVGQDVGAAEYHRQRPTGGVFFENAELVQIAMGAEDRELEGLRESLGLVSVDPMEDSLLQAMRKRSPSRIFDLCVGLNTGSEYALFFQALLRPSGSASPDGWLELSKTARTRSVAGWALVHAATELSACHRGPAALQAITEASRLVPESMTCSYNRVYFALLHGSPSQVMEASRLIGTFERVPAGLLDTARQNGAWSRFGFQERSDIMEAAVRVLPDELATAIEESSR